jgi:hypothetical protein
VFPTVTRLRLGVAGFALPCGAVADREAAAFPPSLPSFRDGAWSSGLPRPLRHGQAEDITITVIIQPPHIGAIEFRHVVGFGVSHHRSDHRYADRSHQARINLPGDISKLRRILMLGR